MKAGTAQSGRTILAVFAAIAMIMSLMAVYAIPADADHGSDVCPKVDGWSEHQTEDLTDDWGSATINGSFVDFQVKDGWTVEVCVKGGPAHPTIATIEGPATESVETPDHPESDEQPEVSHWGFRVLEQGTTFSISGSCEVVEDEATFTISGNLGNGLTLNVAGEVVDESGAFSIDVASSGDYPYTVDLDEGFELADDAPASEGTIVIEDCESSVTVTTDGVCEVTSDGPLGSVDIGIDPSTSASVIVYSDADMTNELFTTDEGGNFTLPPGTYYWSAEAGDGFELTGEDTGSFTIEDCETTVTVTGFCDEGAAFISVTIPDAGSATVEIPGVGVFTESGTQIVEDDQTYSWSATAAAGFSLTETSGEVEIESCSEVMASILVTVESSCEVVDGVGVGTIDVGVSVDNGATVVISEEGGEIGTLTSDGSLTVEPGTYTWLATPNEGFEFPPGFESSGTIVIEDCTPEDEVMASIVVTVGGTCEVVDDEGQGVIDVEISVDGGADVVVSDSDGDVIETLSSSGTVTVSEGATYTWEATTNEGFEFPEGSETSGSITIDTCSVDPETLPFTGLDTGMMSLFGTALLGGGLLLVTAMRRQEEA